MTVDNPAALGAAFPRNFLWGVATAAYQVEGALDEDGRGESIWDRFLREPGRVVDGSDGSIAANHYHRWREDIDLMAALALGAYRFSVSWSRIQPAGRGPANEAGLAFYDRLVDGLLERGIDPVITLLHSDMPAALQDAGGWLARDTSSHFGAFAELVARRLGDRVRNWFTVAEPYTVMRHSHVIGDHAPGLKMPTGAALPVIHHLLLGHGLATTAIRAQAQARIGLTNHSSPTRPASTAAADVAANAWFDALRNYIVTDAILFGRYPEELESLPGADWSQCRAGDFDIIKTPIDWLGLTYFHPFATGAPKSTEAALEPFEAVATGGVPQTTMGWPIVPSGLGEVLTALRHRYGDRLPPLVITENGCSLPDDITEDGRIDDPVRIGYLAGHLNVLAEALRAGIRIDGYFIWSFLDHFEWDLGYTTRWGIVHVDFPTQRRTFKSSAHWYRRLIEDWRTSRYGSS
ncbi:beta-glucosidase [Nordella sp. HKS 07]|uniref:GH1 family beta-glucosidase n=1 Tax=Nordella sp. HKS 07 TaxID=2712222 RepID=UPI0013E1E96A|nr:GH1 family beta-glucosidase [Nordella sp. HKS 07]QIG50478.1 beta-glucosidase [Nordella sp. HKS 07]